MLLSGILLGLMGSLHCVGMCGPIAFMLPVDRSSRSKKFGQIFVYHFGRLLSYSILGLLFGFLGKGLYFFGLQQKLSISIGIVMIVIVLLSFTSFKSSAFTQPLYRLIGNVKKALGTALQKKSADTFLTIGFLNGFLPCGLVYMAVLGAIAMGNPWKGALYMALFGLGTVPLMTTAIYFSGILKASARQNIRKLIPVFVIFVGVLFILRGLGLGIPYISPKPTATSSMETQDCPVLPR
ncbi:sulfite exporter TauE/SafE family protein [Flavobacteriaceae bacterium F89]|uniref:Sulfite exporter TauE/SafE family protein n=1 Tax=Cerina litoralis TaxID=2874477 RepID=A0AAE3EU96_9FLAO|nr:sulfite exporter TauE/SafE family protein [Cerina litoralis]MCG2460239.1 sulfite exporter TauE/SafE family protein [Cerina litoralis]